MKKIKKISIVFVLVLIVGIVGVKASSSILATMANKEVSVEEAFKQNVLSDKGEGFFDIIDSTLLAKDYSYEKNSAVKSAVDTSLKSLKENNPNFLSEYGVKDEMEYLIKSGELLKAQRDVYIKDQYTKLYVNDASLRKLYDEHKGEMVSYSLIEIDEADLENDSSKIDEAKKEIEEKLTNAQGEELKQVFIDMNAKYNSSADESSYVLENQSRENVDEATLKELDKLKYLEFTKKPVTIDEKEYYILKTSKDERLSFDASKEKLTTIQFNDAMQKNSSLGDYLLVQLRQANKIEFKENKDKQIYDARMSEIIADYNKANEEGDK